MKLKPRKGYVVLLMEPDKSPSSIIARPDMDTIKFCKRCGNMMEALGETPCKAQIEWTYNRRGVPEPREVGFSHQVDSVRAPANPSKVRYGRVEEVNGVADVTLGDRVMIHFASGKVIDEWAVLYGEDEYRVVSGEALMAQVEE